MHHIHKALLLGALLIVISILAVFDIVPEAVAQYAPLAIIPFVVSNRQTCGLGLGGRRA
jgi:hypothetical protein